MTVAILLLVLGAALVYPGADLAVRGASTIARRTGLSAFVLGAVLFGIDLEGLAATVAAAGRGETEIAAGGAFGAIVFLFTAAFGAALILARRPVESPDPISLATPSIGVWACALAISDRYLSRLEGSLLLGLYVAYVVLLVLSNREREEEEEEEGAEAGEGLLRWVLLTAAGLALLSLGALSLVAGGGRLAATAGLASGFVGAAILGALTSLDEVLLEVLPLRRGQPDLAVGNLLGTLMAFTTGVPGLAALVRPLSLDAGVNLAFLAAAVTYAIVATTFWIRKRAGRGLGTALVTLYLVWLLSAGTV